MPWLRKASPWIWPELTTQEFARYFRHLADRVERAAMSIPEDQLWEKPLSFGNSIGHLILHLTGNLNHYIGALIAGTGYVRHREHEFTDPKRPSRVDVLANFRQAVEMVVQTLQAQDGEGFATPVADQPPIQTRFGHVPRLCRPHEQPHRPDELPGPGTPVQHPGAAGLVGSIRPFVHVPSPPQPSRFV